MEEIELVEDVKEFLKENSDVEIDKKLKEKIMEFEVGTLISVKKEVKITSVDEVTEEFIEKML